MKKLLKRIGLFDSFTTELEISSHDLVVELNKKTDINEFSLLDFFRDDKKEYVGQISEGKFEMAKWKTTLISIGHLAKAYGKIKHQDDKLIVDVDVYANQAYFVLIGFGLVTIMFSLFGLAFLIGSVIEGDFKEGLLGALALWGFTLIFVGPPLLVMRFSVWNLTYDVEAELKRIEKKKRATTKYICKGVDILR